MGLRLLSSALLCTALVGCGGGDSSPPDSSVNDPGASAGLWKGATSSNRQAYGVLLDTGTYWVIYSAPGNPYVIAGAVEGTAISSSGVFSSTDALDFNLEGLGVTAATVSGNYVPRSTLSGTIRYPGQSVLFSTSYTAALPAAMSQIVGAYQGRAAVVSGTEGVVITVSPSGALSGSGASGCHFTGAASPRSDVPVFDIAVTFGGAPCAMPAATVSGVAFYDTATRVLIGAALLPARTNGFLVLATKS